MEVLPMFKGLNRVFYRVPDLEQAKDWYGKILGKEPVLDSPRAVHFRIGESGLTLVPGKNELDFHPGNVIAYWEVEDMDASFREFLAAGCVTHQEAKTILNRRLGSVIDPFRNVIGLVEQIKTQAAGVEEKPSETALAVALLRALAFHDEREEIKGRDDLAEIFLTEDRKKPLTDLKVREWVLKKALPEGLYDYLIARTVYFDCIVEKALQEKYGLYRRIR
jgi:predicted enzyme related to lactoylglutathione lyase